MPERKYEGVGRCIFCLEDGKELTVEHVIPLALSGVGEMYIQDGSCAGCNSYLNEKYENPALQNDLKGIRALLDLKRRKRKRPILLPEVSVLSDTGEMVTANLSVDEYPPVVCIVNLPPAGLLVGEERNGNLASLQLVFIDLRPKSTAYRQAEMRTPMVSGAVPMMVVKIAYSYAVAEKTIAGFDGDSIRDLLLGRRGDIYNFVGGALAEERLPGRHFHQIFLRRRGKLLTAVVHLFASFGAPAWEVALGETYE